MNKRTVADWEELAASYNASGQRQEQWCKEQGVNPYTFRDQLSRMRKNQEVKVPKRLAADSKTEWLEVQATQQKTAEEITSASSSALVIEIDVFKMIITAETDEILLLKACKALKSLC